MIITSDTIFSWPMAAWLIAGIIVFMAAWSLTQRVSIMWQRVILRAGVLALSFTPSWLLTSDVFTADGPPDAVRAPMVPAWCLIVRAFTDLAPGHLVVALVPVALVTYVLWIAGMSIHHLLRKGP